MKKYFLYSIFVTGAVVLFMASPISASAQTVDSLLEQVQSLLLQVSALQEQLRQIQGSSEFPIATSYFVDDLSVDDTGDSVTKLQRVLTQVGVYTGPVTGYFGPLTKSGVARFQEKYASEVLEPLSLTNGTGYFGESTRKKLNSLLDIQITFAMDGTTKKIVTAQGSPITLTWDVSNINSADPTPCEATVDRVDSEGNIVALTDYYYSWIGSQPAAGSAEILAYAEPGGLRLERIFHFTCETSSGTKTSSVLVEAIDNEPSDLSERMIATLFANGVSGASTVKFSITNIEKLELSWSAVGDALPTVCTLSDFGNVIIAKNLASSDSYTVENPKVGERYYINCTDGEGEYAFDGVELIE